MRTTSAIFCVAVVTGLGACGDKLPSSPESSGVPSPSGAVVSNAQASTRSISSASVNLSLAVSAGNIAYVSAVEETFPDAVAVSIRNQTKNGLALSRTVTDGGFDPIGIDADVDDELTLALTLKTGAGTTVTVRVPRRRPPEVVRTNPGKGRTDVALSILIETVFSEPVDRSTVNSSSITLIQDGNSVKGTVRLSADGLTAEFIPDIPLRSRTTYSLVLDQGIRDLDGDGLAKASTITFTTAVATVGSVDVRTFTTASVASDFDPDGYAISIDGKVPQAIAINGSSLNEGLSLGAHTIVLSGLAVNCMTAGPLSRQFEVVADSSPRVAFDVLCVPGVQYWPTIAFVSERDGNAEIYLASIDGVNVSRLTRNAARDYDPAWSPDGKRIAFASDRNGRNDIYIMNADGSNVVQRTNAGWNESPTWSPDGTSIAFSSWRDDGQYNVYVMKVDGDWANAKRIGPDRGYNAHAAWSPDGTTIAFVSDMRLYDFVYDLYAMNPDGSDQRALILGPLGGGGYTSHFQPAWSPGGARIATVVCPYAFDKCYPNSSIAITNANGTELKVLVNAGGFAHPTWSNDAKTIAFSSSLCRTCSSSIRYVRTNGSSSGTMFADGYSPAWRPGTFIAHWDY